ncbi:MAG TPA: PLD nuclease N-terminal domain-containing protein [Nocardioides sp.]|uniref:PLD nuclease N-terminal domain-containing protein n=1 Tax=Nocardioides sp. TaxID=35761 RepID=UPI002E37D402|nr:PLD nuclease N-terminal domain-containing protein [Nocardioides sp.]HEX5086619.1 PLD nuclease N-terminal domain-containing protein [Nocardioides sp.]
MNTAAVIKLEGLLAVALFCAWVYTLVDVAQTPEAEVRNLNKGAWIVIVLFFSLAGIVGWFVFGRPDHRPRAVPAYERGQPSFPEYDRPGRAAAVDPEKDEAFLEQVRARAEQQRKRYEEQQKREQEEK